MSATVAVPPKVHYPDDDGLPMSDNTLQMKWIFRLFGNLEAQYHADPLVFVAGNHLIYPAEGKNKVRQAPDVFVAFGRPKVYRGSYRVWEEGGVFPQVVFEVWSPGNRYKAMRRKFAFYQEHGAEEYYILYPEFPAHVEGWRRDGGKLVPVGKVTDWVSPRLGVRFRLDRGELGLIGPDGRPYRPVEDLVAEHNAALDRAAQERQRAEQERQRADEAARAADVERAAGSAAREHAAKLAARLRELGVDPDAV